MIRSLGVNGSKIGYIYTVFSRDGEVRLKESSSSNHILFTTFYQAFFLLLFLCVAAACDGVDWESRDLRFQLAVVVLVLLLIGAEAVAEEGGCSMYISPFSIAPMRDQQSAATRELKRTSTWALRMSRRRMNTARDCSAALKPWRITYSNTPADDQKNVFLLEWGVGLGQKTSEPRAGVGAYR